MTSQWLHDWHYSSLHVPKGMQYVELFATLYFDTNRHRDADNFGFVLWKMTKDAMETCKQIPKDDPRYVKEAHEPEMVFDKAKAPLTVVKIVVLNKAERRPGLTLPRTDIVTGLGSDPRSPGVYRTGGSE